MSDASGNGMGALVSEIARLYDGIEELSYYEFLALDRSTDYVAVRDAFYARAQRFHPDRFVATYGQTVKQAVYAVYKRMTEAYQVLSDPELRRRYDDTRAQGGLRLSAVDRSRRLSAEERLVSNVFARLYLRSARLKLESGDLDGAWIDAELGLSVEDAEPLRAVQVMIIRSMAGR